MLTTYDSGDFSAKVAMIVVGVVVNLLFRQGAVNIFPNK